MSDALVPPARAHSPRHLAFGVGAWLALALASAAGCAQPIGGDGWRTDFSKALVDLSEFRSGGPPKDGIPPIDSPHFVAPADAAPWLDPREPVIALEIDGDARAYPLQILMWHEIVNDEVGGVPVAVTFCPLCNASLVFDRRSGSRVLDFGTTGRLRKSDLVMYDRQTESWWQQFTGEALVGALAGTVLEQIPAQIVAFEHFRAAFPDGRVLSRETGFRRRYGENPYRGYDRVGDRPFLFEDPVDPRLPAMERVLAASVGTVHKLYPFSTLRATPVVNDTLAGTPIVVLSRTGTLSALDAERIADSRTVPAANVFERRLGSQVLDFRLRGAELVDVQTGSRWNLLGRALDGPLAGASLRPVPGGVHFAFAWLAFRPDSVIHRAP